MPHRILQIISTLDQAGAEKQMVLLARGLDASSFDVQVCGLTRGGPMAAPLSTARIPVFVVGKRWKADPFALLRLQQLIHRVQPDLVHTWMFTAGAYGRVAARRCGIRHIVHGERCVDQWKTTWQWMIDRRLARVTDRIVANSNGVETFLGEKGLPTDKIQVIPNGVSAGQGDPAVPRSELLRELQIPDDARLIGAVGRLWPQKRVKDLIWALELVCVLHPTTRLLIMGDGPQRQMLERYARLASDLDRVRFLGHRDDVPRILPHLDLLWQGSEYEGQPNAVMEAMAAAVPVIASDIPGHRDLIVPGKTGYLVPIASRAEYGKATDRILSDPIHAHALGGAGQRHIQRNFSATQMVRRYERLYRELLQA